MRVLVVSPVFHGYWSAIAAALEECGHDVVTHCYDTGARGVRVANALAHRVPRLMPAAARGATDRAIAALQAAHPDAVLVVRGDALTGAWWDAVARSGARTALWLYDELTRMTYDAATLRAVDAVYSYSPRDVRTLGTLGIEAVELPDGFDTHTPYTARPSQAVTFIGARYRARERVLTGLADDGVAVAAYGRDWSRHPWDVVRTRHWRAARGVTPHRDVPRSDYYGVMAGSLATLNIHGDGHDGFSMRTFEAPGVGALQLIDRPDVTRHYDVGREVLTFTTDDELRDHITRARREPAWAHGIRAAGRARTLAEHTLTHRMRQVQSRWA